MSQTTSQKNLIASALISLLALPLVGCDDAIAPLRNWGERHREGRVSRLAEEDLKNWMHDLEVSRRQAEELHESIELLVRESNRQGMISWRIAKAYMQQSRFEQALDYFDAALHDRFPDSPPPTALGGVVSRPELEEAIPYFNEALKRHPINSELLFDAALCYGNASVALGWDIPRWQAAVYLFERLHQLRPDDKRVPYQLALLYGKVVHDQLRDSDHAIELLQGIIDLDPDEVPARFALGNLLAEEGQFEAAQQVYVNILDVIEDLVAARKLRGPVSRIRQYNQAERNLQDLRHCIVGSLSCPIQVRE